MVIGWVSMLLLAAVPASAADDARSAIEAANTKFASSLDSSGISEVARQRFYSENFKDLLSLDA